MITIKNDDIRKEVEKHPSKAKLAAQADSTPYTLDRLLEGAHDMNLANVDKIANHLGFDTVVSFVKRTKKPEPATV